MRERKHKRVKNIVPLVQGDKTVSATFSLAPSAIPRPPILPTLCLSPRHPLPLLSSLTSSLTSSTAISSHTPRSSAGSTKGVRAGGTGQFSIRNSQGEIYCTHSPEESKQVVCMSPFPVSVIVLVADSSEVIMGYVYCVLCVFT